EGAALRALQALRAWQPGVHPDRSEAEGSTKALPILQALRAWQRTPGVHPDRSEAKRRDQRDAPRFAFFRRCARGNVHPAPSLILRFAQDETPKPRLRGRRHSEPCPAERHRPLALPARSLAAIEEVVLGFAQRRWHVRRARANRLLLIARESCDAGD